MKVVIVNEGLGYPPRAGNWIRTLNLMLQLADRHEITYVCRGVSETDAVKTAREFYADHGIRAIITSDWSRKKSGPAFYAALAANLLSDVPYSVASHDSARVREEIQRLSSTEPVDIWQFEALAYPSALSRTFAPRTLIMAHNVESLIWERMYQTERHPLKRWYVGRQWRKYEAFEARTLKAAGRVVAVSAEDAALLQSRFGINNPAVVDNGVDLAHFANASDRSSADPNQILFLGSLDWRPNLDALDLLLNQIVPAVVAEEPAARLCIVGRNPAESLVRTAQASPHIRLHADVPDVRPYLNQSGVMAVPLRIGGGSRLKILESLAAGLPVVSTRIGCEGLAFRPGQDLIVVDEVDEMAAALVQCIRAPARAAAMAQNARALIEQRYDWSILAQRLEIIWEETACSAGRA